MKYIDLNIEEYHKMPGISFSGLSQFDDDCPARYKAWKDGITGIDKKAAELGNLVHLLVLEPNLFEKKYTVMPEFEKEVRKPDGTKYDSPKNSTAYKNKVKEFLDENKGKNIIAVSDYDYANYIAESVRNNRLVTELLLPDGEAEMSYFWEEAIDIPVDKSRCYHCGGENEIHWMDDITTCIHCQQEYKPNSVLLKTRPDYVNGNICIDLKTTKSCKYSDFYKAVKYVYNYDAQASLQIQGLTQHGAVIDEYYWIAVEKERPHIVHVFKASDEVLTQGKQKIDKWLKKYKWCFDTNNYPGYERITVLGE